MKILRNCGKIFNENFRRISNKVAKIYPVANEPLEFSWNVVAFLTTVFIKVQNFSWQIFAKHKKIFFAFNPTSGVSSGLSSASMISTSLSSTLTAAALETAVGKKGGGGGL